MKSQRHLSTGVNGEALARTHLESHGLITIESNWRCPVGELDLVMRSGEMLVFVEVKTRYGDRAGRAEDAIGARKARRLLDSAEWYVAEHPEFAELVWRIDLLAITLDGHGRIVRLSHLPNAIVIG